MQKRSVVASTQPQPPCYAPEVHPLHKVMSAMGILLLTSALTTATTTVSNLQGTYRDGQVFLTWQETDTPAGTTFNVYINDCPIVAANLKDARRIGHHVEQRSARDWWQDPASFAHNAESDPPAGFVMAPGAAPLDPAGGLFVHTVTEEDPAKSYFAVTSTNAAGEQNTEIAPGQNSLHNGIAARVALIQPIWIGDGAPPAAGAGGGKAVELALHGRGGGTTAGERKSSVNYLMFGNARQGWRGGLARKFSVRIAGELVTVTPSDRAWTGGRPITESRDRRDHCPAFNTWWYGYNQRVYETTEDEKPVCPNFTEHYLLWLVRWAQQYLGTDPNQTYIRGSSMGGSGTISMVLHHPEIFAAAVAIVPIYAYTRPGRGSAVRLQCVCGPNIEAAVTGDGVPLLQHMDGTWQVRNAKGALPYIFAMNGRQDSSIPWENNPPFYRAMNETRQGFTVYWNNGPHGMQRTAPADCNAWLQRMHRFRLNESFPAFSNSSDDRDPGNGDPTDGDLEGWINRGLDWQDLVDTPEQYALTVTADYPDIQYPVTVDITPRRIQHFSVKPGKRLHVDIAGNTRTVTVAPDGLFTIPAVPIRDRNGSRIRITK